MSTTSSPLGMRAFNQAMNCACVEPAGSEEDADPASGAETALEVVVAVELVGAASATEAGVAGEPASARGSALEAS